MPIYKTVSAEEAVSIIQSNQNVFIHSVAATPTTLIEALTKRADELRNVRLHHLHVEGDLPYLQYPESFRVNNLFTGANTRKAVNEGMADYTPVFLSEVPILFRKRIIPLDVALLQVSLPDRHGFCSLGISIDCSLAALESAKYVIAEINPHMPRTHGDGIIHISKIHAFISVNHPLHTITPPEPNEIERKIGEYIAEMIEDGSTLQMGIGSIPNAVLACLGNHKDLGIHTEMFSDGVLPLIKSGVITGNKKQKHRNKIVVGFILGSQDLYDFVNDNPMVRFLDIEYVNNPTVIMQQPKMVAINSAIEVDLTGQVCADSIGTNIYSGVGGQMDFIRGAALSQGGKPIIALPSVTSKGESRITTVLKPGAGVVTTRAHVHYVVTEYGVAYLYGKTIRERVKALIQIAHPNHRERLEREAFEYWKVK
ncbi:MAG: 4-hydroxybutyrate CoA-transferase [Microscillaceae bacterium]|nr:4-hydroxybutyrate CoA-transferase [Microscillaceae bacterium]MDW8460716.1 acetyl-CoA hydrolase/transferase C-terminal domain-containing protein [Cytophagales bacterium]